MNPWWSNKPQPRLPHVRRWAFGPLLESVHEGLAPITVLRGPRQIGKSTLVRQIIERLLEDGISPKRILFVQFDELKSLERLNEPILLITRWFENSVAESTLNESARDDQTAYLFFDEIQNLDQWAPQLKSLVDNATVRILATGSSALRIQAGRDSLAGRVTTFEIGPLFLREISEIRGWGPIEPALQSRSLSALRNRAFWENLREIGLRQAQARDRAFDAFSDRGAYPIAHARPNAPWDQLAAQLNETVVRRAIEHDLRMSAGRGRKRDETLLELVFRLACRYVGQAPAHKLFVDEVREGMHTAVGWQRINAYMRFLDGALLLRLIEPLELRLKKRRGPPKIVLCDHALRASWLQETIPVSPRTLAESPHLADLAGRIAESIAGYFFREIPDLGVAHFPPRGGEPEVDFILTVGDQRIPIEVKYRRAFTDDDLAGLRSFIQKPVYNAPFGVVVTLDDRQRSSDPRIVSIPLSTLLLMR
jgi:predicted AAA+ superfamily ATPase